MPNPCHHHCMRRTAACPFPQAILLRVALAHRPRTVCETGFNAGQSALLWLLAGARVVSFDLALHPYVEPAHLFLQARFPGMLELVKGDSRDTISKYANAHPEMRCDIVHVDGGHNNDLPLSDLRGLRRLAHPGTLLVMDDVQCRLMSQWCAEPTDNWHAAQHEGLVAEHSCYTNHDTTKGLCLGTYSNWKLAQGPPANGRYEL